jgi:glycosyltransferase involved in cell wall biosynthesis
MAPALPGFTIVTPSFNQGHFIERTIRSVVDQGYPDLEYFVMDAGSTDGTVEIIKRYEDKIDYWVSQPDGGQSAAINAGWSRGSREIVAWLNSDDYYLPGSLRSVAEYMGAHPDAMVVYGRTAYVDAEGSPLGDLGWPFDRRTMIMSRNVIPQPSAFIRREALERAGMLDETLHYVMDFEFFLRIAQLRAPVFVPHQLAAMTAHPDAKTTRGRDRMAQERWQVRLRYARAPEKPILWVGQKASRLFHLMPPGVRAGIDRIRHMNREAT